MNAISEKQEYYFCCIPKKKKQKKQDIFDKYLIQVCKENNLLKKASNESTSSF